MTNSNSSNYVDYGDFDIIADRLTQDEVAEVKQRIIDTCNSLKIT
uniref:Acyl carrier protein n=1 Tax=Angiostrongylus cantonensis TaxID=6313 RepID=A0A0K0CV93_ANGCA